VHLELRINVMVFRAPIAIHHRRISGLPSTHVILFTVELLKGSSTRPLPGFFP